MADLDAVAGLAAEVRALAAGFGGDERAAVELVLAGEGFPGPSGGQVDWLVGELGRAAEGLGGGRRLAQDATEAAWALGRWLGESGLDLRERSRAAAEQVRQAGDAAAGRPAGSWRVEVVFDTAMWNEAFEMARCPWADALVDDRAAAEALAGWVGSHPGNARGWNGTADLVARVCGPVHGVPVSEAEARVRLGRAVESWTGL